MRLTRGAPACPPCGHRDPGGPPMRHRASEGLPCRPTPDNGARPPRCILHKAQGRSKTRLRRMRAPWRSNPLRHSPRDLERQTSNGGPRTLSEDLGSVRSSASGVWRVRPGSQARALPSGVEEPVRARRSLPDSARWWDSAGLRRGRSELGAARFGGVLAASGGMGRPQVPVCAKTARLVSAARAGERVIRPRRDHRHEVSAARAGGAGRTRRSAASWPSVRGARGGSGLEGR